MKILYDEDSRTIIDLSDCKNIEEGLIAFHILMFRFMQVLTENLGIDLDTARKFCTMNDKQLEEIMAVELELALERRGIEND